jgi:regulatory protein
MPVITEFREIPRKPKRRIMVLDDDREIEIGLEIALTAGIAEGRTVTPQGLHRAILDDQLREAQDTALRLLSHKQLSHGELRRKLSLFGKEAVENAVAKCAEWGYLNDRKLAELIVRDSVELKRHGPRRIRQTLYKRGIDEETANAAVAAFDGEQPPLVEQALAALKSKRRSLERLDEQTARRRITGFLQRRGFDFGTIREATDVFMTTSDD